MGQDYLRWVIKNTKTAWWHDSARPNEITTAIKRGAVGATTNPFLANQALARHKTLWAAEIDEVYAQALEGDDRAEALMRIAITHAAKQFLPEYQRSNKVAGYVCAQVNPGFPGDREIMLAMARRLTLWAPNIAVKLPATAAGLDVLEDCIAEGMTCMLTVSYTVAQVIAIAETHRRGIQRAKAKSIEPGKCFAVIMIGRLDDYLRAVVHDTKANVSESDIRQAGLAVTKRAYAISEERGYETVLIVAALRGTHHMTELAGADLTMSIAVPYQDMLISPDIPCEPRFDVPIAKDVIDRLSQVPEFVKAYDPEGMQVNDFITYGVTQQTITQFLESGWKLLSQFQP